MIIRTLTAALLATTALPSQSSLAEIERAYDERQTKLSAETDGIISYEDHTKLSDWFAAQLEKYLTAKPNAKDHTLARVTLATTYLNVRDQTAAQKALKGVDPARASMLDLLEAADLAARMRMDAERNAWIDKALAKDAPFADQMQAGMILMTRLVEPERSLALFEKARQSAKTDEHRAEVLWHLAAATREREDRGEGDYEKSLAALAKQYPKTLFGGIARDRLRAMAYEVGDDAVLLSGTAFDGKPFALKDLRGKAALIWFWASWSPECRAAIPHIEAMVEKFSPAKLAVFGVSLDETRDELASYLQQRPSKWRNLYDGKSFESPHALRSNAEQVPHMLLIDGEGKVAALRLFLHDAEEIAHVTETIAKTLR